jgi:hypothetical protein
MFEEATRQVFGSTRMLARVIKVGDVNVDGSPDILVGTTFQTQSQLFLGDGSGNFTNVTKTHLPQINASVGDLEFGDADGDEDLDVVAATVLQPEQYRAGHSRICSLTKMPKTVQISGTF